MEPLAPSVGEFVESYLTEVSLHLRGISPDALSRCADYLLGAYRAGAQVLIAGNGGSASTASHLACDLAKTVLGASPTTRSSRFRVVSLADNVALLSAWANDEGYETVFAEQVKMLGREGDVLVVLSASGNSPNIVAAVEIARGLGLKTVALLGFEGGAVGPLADASLVVPCHDFGHVESAHLVVGHLLTEWFRREIAAAV